MNVSRFGAFVRSRRELLGITQKDLARIIGKDASLVSQWERGVVGSNFPDPETVDKLATALHTSFDELARSFGYRAGEPEPERRSPDADLFTSLAEDVEWANVPDYAREMVIRDFEMVKRIAEENEGRRRK